MAKQLLIIFYKNPLLGKVKTRLAATLGEEKALAIYLDLTAHTRNITSELPVDKVVYYSDYVDTEDNWDNNIYNKQLQQGIDLGEKMKNSFSRAFDQGYTTVCIIGTDSYEITSDIIMRAFDYLEEGDAVIGPAVDGGYYLLGLKKIEPSLFTNKEWGHYTVLGDTLEDLDQLGLRYGRLPVLRDVDEESDMPKNSSLL